ncbi:MAG: single-stranded DNA-binding protein [Opitutae bacterium]|jgi:single-strand DNA-binding protein|nr:single-stranded DNA-binding protein [Opitutae bacterium]
MASFNKVILMGNLTRDPELRVTAGGISICKIGLAVNRVYSTKDGERREEVTYVDIDAFGKQAEVISKYMRKGRPLFVEGRLKFDQWESEGQKRSKLGVVLDKFEFIGGREDGDSGQSAGYDKSSPPARTAATPAATPAVNFSNDNDTLDEDVPF